MSFWGEKFFEASSLNLLLTLSVSHSVMSDSVTPWTLASQAPLSVGFSRQEYWSGLPFLSPGDLPDPGIEPRSPALQEDSLLCEPPGKPYSELNKGPVELSQLPWGFMSLFFDCIHIQVCLYMMKYSVGLQKQSNCLSWQQLEFVEDLTTGWNLALGQRQEQVGCRPGGLPWRSPYSWAELLASVYFSLKWGFPDSQVVKTSPSSARGTGLIPGLGAKIAHTSQPENRNIKQKQYCNRFNEDFENGPHQKGNLKKMDTTPTSGAFLRTKCSEPCLIPCKC